MSSARSHAPGLALLALAAGCWLQWRSPEPGFPLPVPPPEPHASPGAAAPLFAADDVLELELRAPLRSVFAERRGERHFHPARLLYGEADGRQVELEVEVKLRGEPGDQQELCTFPPLEVRLPREQVAGTVFAGQHVLGLVTHCRSAGAYEQRTLLRYLVHRTLELLTDLSFRARLLRIEYHDTDELRPQLTRYAFVTESHAALAARTGWGTVQRPYVSPAELEPNQMSLVEVFQYMIGNSAWSAERARSNGDCCENVRLLGGPGSPLIPIPHDFDSCSVVEAPWSSPSVRARSARRSYRGFCRHPLYLGRTFALFRERRDDIYALYRGQEGLDERHRARTLAYFDSFYETIDDLDEVRREFLRECR